MKYALEFPVSEESESFELLLAIRCMQEFNYWKNVINDGELTKENIKRFFDSSHQLISSYSDDKPYSWYKSDEPLTDNFDMKYTDIDIDKFINATVDEREGFHLHQYDLLCMYFIFREKIELSVGFLNEDAYAYLREELEQKTEKEVRELIETTDEEELKNFIEDNFYDDEFSDVLQTLKNNKQVDYEI